MIFTASYLFSCNGLCGDLIFKWEVYMGLPTPLHWKVHVLSLAAMHPGGELIPAIINTWMKENSLADNIFEQKI